MKGSTTLTPEIVFCYICDADRETSHGAGVALQAKGRIQRKAWVLLVPPPAAPHSVAQPAGPGYTSSHGLFSEFIVTTLGIAGLCN